MKKLYLGLAIHNHQPGDNFVHVFELAYKQSYLPLIEALERHPGVRISLHYSGCLLDWLIENRPDFLERIAALVKKSGIADKVKHRKLIIPGYIASESGGLEEELPGWQVIVGPREGAHIPPFLKNWKA